MVLTDRPLFILFGETVVAFRKKIILCGMELTVAQLAKKLKVHRGTIYRHIITKSLPKPWKAKVHLKRLYVTDED